MIRKQSRMRLRCEYLTPVRKEVTSRVPTAGDSPPEAGWSPSHRSHFSTQSPPATWGSPLPRKEGGEPSRKRDAPPAPTG